MSTTRPARTAWFANRPVFVKVVAAVVPAAVVAVGVGVTALGSMGTISDNGDYVYEQNLLPIVSLGTVKSTLSEMKQDLSQYVLSVDAAHQTSKLADIKADDAMLDTAFAAYTATDMTGREAQVAAFTKALAQYRSARDQQEVPAGAKGNSAAYQTAHAAAADAADAAAGALDALLTIEDDSAAAHLAASHAQVSSARRQLIVLLVVGLLAGVGLAALVTRMITRPLGRV